MHTPTPNPNDLHGFTPHAISIAERQYAQPNDNGLRGIFERVATWIASNDPEPEREQRTQQYLDLMLERRFCPGGRVLAGANTNHNNALNCFVQDESPNPRGSTDGALALALKLALVTKVGGGNGLNLDAIPPKHLYTGPLGRAFITINPNHPDAEKLTTGTYLDLTRGEYITRPYQHLTVTPHDTTPTNTTRITVPDSVEGIWSAASSMVHGLLRGENILLDLSDLRPEGAHVNGSGGTSSGPSSFAVVIYENYAHWAALGGAEHAGPVATLRYIYATTLSAIRQGGSRRGAGMATLDATHPDIHDFITAKDLQRERDEGDISTFNISVLVSDDLMRAAAIHGTPANHLMRDIAQHAWATGEPGLIFIDRVNEHNAAREILGDIRATNPCVTGDTLILTSDGPRRFDELAQHQRDTRVITIDPSTGERTERTMRRPHRTRHNTPTYRVKLHSGLTLRVTPDHKFLLPNLTERIEAQHLTPGTPLATWTRHPTRGIITDPQHDLVTSVAPAGNADVYNGMVEDTHNYCIIDPTDHTRGIISANCGEIPLTPGEPCDLGAINLARYVTRDQHNQPTIDTTALQRDTHTAVRFLDNILDLNGFALEQNRIASHNLRRLGLGVMGLADTLIELGVRYDTPEGRDTTTSIMNTIRDAALQASQDLARERGAFPAHAEITQHAPLEPRRNIAILTVAPTGTTSMLFGVSSGIEPNFAAITYRRIGTEHVTLISPLLERLLNDHQPTTRYRTSDNTWDWNALARDISTHHGAIQPLIDAGDLPDEPRLRAFLTAHEITPEAHVLMQATIQRAFDAGNHKIGNSLSKTINLPREATPAHVFDAYALAHQHGSKGITVYRDGSRDLQVLNTSSSTSTEASSGEPASDAPRAPTIPSAAPALTTDAAPGSTAASRATPPHTTYQRGTRMRGFTDHVRTTDVSSGHARNFFVTINEDEAGAIREVFITSGKAGDEANADAEALGRLISIALQHGVPTRAIIKTLRGINGGLYGTYQNRIVSSKADLIAVALATANDTQSDYTPTSNGTCPDCGSPLILEEGCAKCTCGWSKC